MAAIFFLIVLAPMAALAWLGARVAREERAAARRRIDGLLVGRLRDVEGRIAQFLQRRQREALALTEIDEIDPERIREIVRGNPIISQIFALDPKGLLLHPPLPGATESERQFLARTRRIWEDRDLREGGGEALAVAALSQSAPTGAAARSADAAPAPPPASRGWHVWYWDKGINLLAWRLDAQGRTIGAELDGSRLLADLIAELPSNDASASLPADAVLALVDQHGQTIYQWGGWRGGENAKPEVILQLGYPLSAWRLEYRAAPGALAAGSGAGAAINLAAGGAALALALVGLAIYFFREQTREMREAAQRVSFVNQVSHELKTPLTNIRMYAELLDREIAEEDEKPKRQLKVIVEESQRLSRLIGNILAFSRQQRGKLALRPAPGRVDDVIRAAIEHYAPSMRAKGIEIEFRGGAEAEAMIDADALEQILGNLFSNVEKYAAAGRWTGIESRQTGDTATITVSDRGPGIEAAHREKIFQPFYRVSDKLTEGVAGAGIGLALARDLARLHGGDLKLGASMDGVAGASFELTIRTANRKAERGLEA